MRTKKVTLLLFLTVLSLLTMFLVVLLDDTVLAAAISNEPMFQKLNLSEMPWGAKVAAIQPGSEARISRDELKPMKAV